MILTLFDLIIGNSMFQIEHIKMFANTAFGKLEQIVYDQLIKNKQRCCYKRKSVLPLTFYKVMKVIDVEPGVVSFHYWLLYCQFYCH